MEGDSADDLQQSHDDGPFHGSLPADHPMLQQAQEKLKQQLLAIKQRLEEELQERKYAIKVPLATQTAIRHVEHKCSQMYMLTSTSTFLFTAHLHILQARSFCGMQPTDFAVQAAQEERLNLGVELYGFQQQLAQIQKIRQESESKAAQLAAEREEEEPALVGLRQQAAQNAQKLDAQKAEVRAHLKPLSIKCPLNGTVVPILSGPLPVL